ncbi:M56 family metallopeptidase [Dactylosporangium sp. CA-092794]|uniref:M56 family metallopeptidase n=1 Tax=Dactylosporangium sp. CA-092794 TaxID=3239929 RepID=UPI003D8F0806
MSPLLLAGYATLLMLAAPRLAGAGWVARAPRLAVAAWLALTAALLLSGVLAGVGLMLYWDCTHDLVAGAWHACLDALLGRHHRRAHAAALAGLAALLLLGARLALGADRSYAARRALRSRLRLLVRMTAPDAIPGATVVAHPHPAAYLVPGRAADIVITTAAVNRLAPPELSAVLAHERGHHAGRHYRAVHWTRLLAEAFPRVLCFRLARQQVDRLVELCADDTAARSTRRIDLARALVAMSSPPPPTADGALCAQGGDALERLHRLLAPPRPLSRTTRAGIAVTCPLLPLVPLTLALIDRLA